MALSPDALRYLRALAFRYPSTDAALAAMADREAALSLPKGTVHVVSDVHGEDKKLAHILRNASGSLRPLVEAVFGSALSPEEKTELLTLVYYPREAFERRAGPARRQRRSRPQPRWRLPLPETFEQFLASRSANTRWRLRRDARRIADAFGGRVELAVVRDPGGLDRLLGDAERVARSTYQRALGTGFAVTPERREATRVGLERGWTRGYLLYARDEPVAFWICSVYRGTLLVRLTGYDDRYAGLRVGIHLLARVIEDAIRDPAIAVVDFGPGDAAYKRQLAAESHLERDLVVFAPTLRGVRINAGRNAVLLAADGARRALDAARLTDRVRTGWRLRLRR